MKLFRPSPTRFSELPPERQLLVRVCQHVNFGFIRDLAIKRGRPDFDPSPMILKDIKLDGEEVARPEAELADFELAREVRRLMHQLDDPIATRIDSIEIRAGLPKRILLRVPSAEYRVEEK